MSERATSLASSRDAVSGHARHLLGNLAGELNAQRFYLLGQIAWAANDNDTFYRTVADLRQAAPTSPWLEQALLSAANRPKDKNGYDFHMKLPDLPMIWRAG